MSERWAPGDSVALRWRREENLGHVNAVTVVEDSPELVALYLAAGSEMKRPVSLDGRAWRDIPAAERFRLADWAHDDGVWRDMNVLQLARPENHYGFWAFWAAGTWEFRGWYVNLQAPLARTPVGFDSRDYVLDIWVERDGAWRWKDEEEFAEACRAGRFTDAEAELVRAAGEKAIAIAEAGAWPLGHGWEGWRPDASWPVASLPADWDAY